MPRPAERGTNKLDASGGPAKTEIEFDIQPQPNDVTCGPTCLQAVYEYYGDDIPLARVIGEVKPLDDGGTLAVLLGSHALRRGYNATLYTCNLQVFDPTWAGMDADGLTAKLEARLEGKTNPKLRHAIRGYLQYLELGGEVRFDEINARLLHKHLKKDKPVLTGLSATYLYRSARERASDSDPSRSEYDDVTGDPAGHFVILRGYDKINRKVLVADPLYPNPMAGGRYYEVDTHRLICSILLGALTYDANLLIVEPKRTSKKSAWKV